MDEWDEFEDQNDAELENLSFQVDMGRGVIVLPMYEDGRKILPSLFEAPIVELLDEDYDTLDLSDHQHAVFAVCVIPGDQEVHSVVEIDYPGVTIH